MMPDAMFDRVAIVTGGAGSLGRAIVRALARSGAAVAVADQNFAAAREDFPLDRTVHHVPHAGDHRLLVHIQTGAMWV